jgi:hypothetical protein
MSRGPGPGWMQRSFVSVPISWKPSLIRYLQAWCSCPGPIIARQLLVVRYFEYNIRMDPVETSPRALRYSEGAGISIYKLDRHQA